MLKIAPTALASLLAFGGASAAEQAPSKQQNENGAVQVGPTTAGETANRTGIVTNGSTLTHASGTAVSQSGMRAPALVPMIPFSSYAMSGNAVHDADLQRQLQDIQEREQRMLQYPEYRDLLRAQQRLSISQMHRDLAEFLQLSKQQTDELFDLLAEQRVRAQTEPRPIGLSHADPAAAQAFMERSYERQRANEAEVAALLGASKFQEWKDYEQSGMARFLVQRLQQSLPNDAPLRADQARSLVRAVAREQRQLFEDRTLTLGPGQVFDQESQKRLQKQQVERMAASNQRILDAAAPILSPQQLEQFESMLQQELEGHSQRALFFGGRAPLTAPSTLLPLR